jgi:hypothetical protein
MAMCRPARRRAAFALAELRHRHYTRAIAMGLACALGAGFPHGIAVGARRTGGVSFAAGGGAARAWRGDTNRHPRRWRPKKARRRREVAQTFQRLPADDRLREPASGTPNRFNSR